MIEKHQNAKKTLNLANIERHIIFAVACLLVFMPVSLASQSVEPANREPDLRNVTLWDYNVDMRASYDYFWTATNPSKYITPDNPIIRYYANNTQEIQIDYAPDDVDHWQNPDYTLKIMRGDCEDETFVWVSIHRAKGHKAIAVGGYLYFDDGTAIRDIWYEYVDNNTRQRKFVTPVVNVRKFYSKPLFMFNDAMGIRDYDPDWMKKA